MATYLLRFRVCLYIYIYIYMCVCVCVFFADDKYLLSNEVHLFMLKEQNSLFRRILCQILPSLQSADHFLSDLYVQKY